MIPAMKFASVWRAAKPRIAAAIAPEASRLVASWETPVKPESAIAIPITRIAAYSSRRTNRSRVAPSRLIFSPPPRAARPRKARSSSVAATNAIRIAAPAWIQVPASASLMAPEPTPRAILFDALGTLLTFEPPAPHLRAALLERTGPDIGAAGAEAAIRAEIAYYRAHLHEGSDPESLHGLRLRCADAMGLPFAREVVFDALMDA